MELVKPCSDNQGVGKQSKTKINCLFFFYIMLSENSNYITNVNKEAMKLLPFILHWWHYQLVIIVRFWKAVWQSIESNKISAIFEPITSFMEIILEK